MRVCAWVGCLLHGSQETEGGEAGDTTQPPTTDSQRVLSLRTFPSQPISPHTMNQNRRVMEEVGALVIQSHPRGHTSRNSAAMGTKPLGGISAPNEESRQALIPEAELYG